MSKIKIKRGLKANLPILNEGEFAYCTDTKELFIGSVGGNINVGSEDSIQHLLDYTRNPAIGSTAGTSTSYTLSVSPEPVSILTNTMIIIKPHVNCGINPTITINSLTSISLRNSDESLLDTDDLKTGFIYAFRSNGTNFILEYTNDMSQYEPVGSGIIISATEPTEIEDGMVWIKKSV